MKNTKLSIIGIIMLVLFSALVTNVGAEIEVTTYTASNDFIMQSNSQVLKVCACSTTQDSITITNTGTWPAIFTVQTDNENVLVTENNFELQPLQSKQVLLIVNANCNKGSQDYSIIVTSNLGIQKVLDKTLTKDRCQNIELWNEKYLKDLKPCQTRAIELYVKNVGTFKEEYTLSSNYDEFITYNTQLFSLEPNQAAKVAANVQFDCDMYGIKTVEFTAKSVNNKLEAVLPVELIIAQDYNYELKLNSKLNTTNLEVCNRVTSTQIPFSIKNIGSVENTYSFEVKGFPKFAKHNIQTVTLKPGEEKVFTIDVDSTKYRYEHKDYDLQIKVNPKIGDIYKTENILLQLLPCYEHLVKTTDAESVKENNEKYPLEVCSEYLYEKDVEIINNGRYKETYDLSLEGNPSSVSLSQNKVTVNPGEKTSVKLIILGPECDTTYNVKVVAKIFNGIYESDNFWIKSYDKQSCHNVEISFESSKVNYQTEKVVVPIKNTGIVEGKYIAYWNGSKILNLDDTLIELNKSQTKKVTLEVKSDGLNESTYSGQLIVENLDSDATYVQEISVTLKDKNVCTKAFEYFAYGTTCRQITFYELLAIPLLIILIIVFIVTSPKYPYKFVARLKSKRPEAILLTVIFLIAAILVITTNGLPKTQTEVYNLSTNVSELRFEWLQDDNYELDISKFFSDPDNNTLEYNVTGLDNIKAIVTDKTVTFYPNMGWSGTEYARIVAYDSEGGSVRSPKIELIVRNVPKKSFVETYEIYCPYVNLAIFAVLLLLVFVAIFVKQKKRSRK